MLTQSNKKQLKQFKNQSQAGYMQNNESQTMCGETGSRKMTMQFKKQFENQSQSGRSMIEMLGVLAIIAILSIGGIVGYRLAMNYYQANQIAHEMNIMRTDAQIKVTQGTEKLMLGDPYDSGNIQFNGYKTDFDCLDMETETSEPKIVSCAIANAYYIELQEIPEGVCKPLANLIDKMDNEIAFYINGKSVDATEEKGACGEGNNTLKVIFGADSDSNAVKCDTDTECESLESTPVCDIDRHVCVECEDNSDCENPDEPKCEESTHTCAPCPPKSVFHNGECVSYECHTNEDCNSDDEVIKYCYLEKGYQCAAEWGGNITSGQCKNIETSYKLATINEHKYYFSTEPMDWWSANRFCQALQEKIGRSITLITLFSFSCNSTTPCEQSELRQKLYENFKQNVYFWLKDTANPPCDAYHMNLSTGHLQNAAYHLCDHPGGSYALCEKARF